MTEMTDWSKLTVLTGSRIVLPFLVASDHFCGWLLAKLASLAKHFLVYI